MRNEKEKEALSLYIKRLYDIGFAKMIRIPTYQAPEYYKKTLFWEDVYYRRFDSDSVLLFKEGGSQRRFIPQDIENKFGFFVELLTTGHIEKNDFERFIGMEISNKLNDANLCKIHEGKIELKFRVIPMPPGTIITDFFSQTSDENVHVGLDSILFWNFLVKQKGRLSRMHHILDLGCGTGIHSLLLKTINPDVQILCTDISLRSLDYTKENMIINGIDTGINYLQSDWFEQIRKLPDNTFDVILCNPPFEWRTEDEKEFHTMFSYGGHNYGMEKTLTIFREFYSFLNENGKGYILSQSVVSDDKKFLLVHKINNMVKELNWKVRIKIRILYEHLLTTETLIRHMFSNNFSHFALLIIEIEKTGKRESVELIDDRPLCKRISDRNRVKACRHYWKSYLYEHT